jgi:hypothetical protein
MEIESIFLDSKWQILTELSHASLSPTELAEKTGTSIANISAQLRLLEALDFIGKEKLSNVAKGQPRKLFSLKKEFAYLILGTKSVIGKKMFRLDSENMPFFTLWLINEPNIPFALMRLFLDNEYLLKDCISIGYLGTKAEEIELLVIHQNPSSLYHLNEKQITRNDNIYKIRAHLHTKEAFQQGVNNKEEYFLSVLKKVFILFDKENVVSKPKKGYR